MKDKIKPYWLFAACSAALLFSACSKKEGESKDAAASLKPASAHAPSEVPAPSGADLKFTAPSGWISETPTSSMRKAQYKLAHVEGETEDAELAVFYFQGGGGGVQANIDRWIAQFSKADGSPVTSEARITHKQSHGVPLTIVDVSGVYNNAMGPDSPTPSKQSFRLLGAVAEAGNGPWFFKLTGPAKTVAKWEPSFHSFLDTIQ
jgi:hypothetical protein